MVSIKHLTGSCRVKDGGQTAGIGNMAAQASQDNLSVGFPTRFDVNRT